MPSISKCPKCRQEVTIPDRVDQDAEVRCPLCAAVYPLGDATAEAPPALIPIDVDAGQGGVGQGLSPDSDALLKTNLVTAPFHVPESDAEAGPETEAPSDAVPESAEDGAQPSADEEPQIDAWQKADETPQIDLGAGDKASSDVDTGQAAVDTEAFAGFAEDDSEDSDAPRGSGALRLGRKKKEKNVAKEMVGAVVGGFLGLAIGYYALNYFGGERFDFMEIYLPGVAHTDKHKPSWAKGDAQEPDEAQSKADDQQPQQSPTDQPDTPADNPVVQPEPSPVASPDGAPVDPPIVEPEDEPQPAPLPEGYVGLLERPSFTSDELGDALKAAHDLVSTVEDVDTLSPEAFEELCRLAHVLSFVTDDPADGRLQSRKEAVGRILRDLVEAPGRIDEIGLQAGRLLQNEEIAEPGILLAGTAGRVVSKDGLHGTTIRLAVHPESISVFSDDVLPFEADDQVIILGSIVNDPVENLVGYSGTKPRVIWAGMAVKARR